PSDWVDRQTTDEPVRTSSHLPVGSNSAGPGHLDGVVGRLAVQASAVPSARRRVAKLTPSRLPIAPICSPSRSGEKPTHEAFGTSRSAIFAPSLALITCTVES